MMKYRGLKILLLLSALGWVAFASDCQASLRTQAGHSSVLPVSTGSPINLSSFDPSEAHAMVIPQNDERSLTFKTHKTRFIKDIFATLELLSYVNYQYDPLVCLFHAQTLGWSTSLRAPPIQG